MNQEAQWLLKEKYQGQICDAYLSDLKRLEALEPLAYIIGSIPFLGCTIYLESHPLIPRPETEFWVEKFINEIKGRGRTPTLRVLDLCAGSGAIGVAVAHLIPTAHITLAEIDRNHFPTIGKNLNENDIDCSRYQVYESDLFSNILGKFDFILSNPPYIDKSLNRTESSVVEHEPDIALYGGQNGMEIIEKIISAAPTYLNSDGQLWLEHEPEQVERINHLAQEHFKVEHHDDQYGVKRYSTLTLRHP
jgi:release factor glutamine methyltransferase